MGYKKDYTRRPADKQAFKAFYADINNDRVICTGLTRGQAKSVLTAFHEMHYSTRMPWNATVVKRAPEWDYWAREQGAFEAVFEHVLLLTHKPAPTLKATRAPRKARVGWVLDSYRKEKADAAKRG